MLLDVARFAMHRDRDLRPDHLVHLDQLVARRMAGDMHQMIALGDHLDAAQHEPIVQPPDRLLIAGNDARGKDHRIARVEFGVGMRAGGDPRQRGAHFALAAGAEIENLVLREVFGFLLADEVPQAAHQSDRGGGGRHAVHRAAHQADPAIGGLGGERLAQTLGDRRELAGEPGQAGLRQIQGLRLNDMLAQGEHAWLNPQELVVLALASSKHQLCLKKSAESLHPFRRSQ